MLKKVLVVDDSELIHNMFQLILKKYRGCILVKAMNGKEALDKLTLEEGIELILLDINMPIMNGIQFMETVKAMGRHTNIPIIIVSMEGKEEDVLKGLNLGAKGYIVKPFKSIMLHNLIESIFNKEPISAG